MSLYVAVPALIGIAVLGWLAGMLTFKRSQTWCPRCGDSLDCVRCIYEAMNAESDKRTRSEPLASS